MHDLVYIIYPALCSLFVFVNQHVSVYSVGKLEMEFYGIMHMKNIVFLDLFFIELFYNIDIINSIIYGVTQFISTWRTENTVVALSETILRKIWHV